MRSDSATIRFATVQWVANICILVATSNKLKSDQQYTGQKVRKSIVCMIVVMMGAVASCADEDIVTLNAESTDEQIMRHMAQHELNQTQTGALAEFFPVMSRDRAYAIQRLRLADRTRTREQVGWKLGWTRKESPEIELDPIVGHYTVDRVYEEGKPLSTRYFTEGTARAEPEIVFYLKKDLPGPVISPPPSVLPKSKIRAQLGPPASMVTHPSTVTVE